MPSCMAVTGSCTSTIPPALLDAHGAGRSVGTRAREHDRNGAAAEICSEAVEEGIDGVDADARTGAIERLGLRQSDR
jgi:hypothetical protein